MANFTLDDIRNAAEAKFGSLDITLDDGTVVKLLNPMRLPSAKRADLLAKQDELGALEDSQADDYEGESVSQVDVIESQERIIDEMLMIVVENKVAGKKLLTALGGDITYKMTVFEKYNEGTQAGEASASQD